MHLCVPLAKLSDRSPLRPSPRVILPQDDPRGMDRCEHPVTEGERRQAQIQRWRGQFGASGMSRSWAVLPAFLCLRLLGLSEVPPWLMAQFFFFFFFFFRAASEAYGSSQARGPIGAAAAGLYHCHSNTGSKPHLGPIPQLTATPDP